MPLSFALRLYRVEKGEGRDSRRNHKRVEERTSVTKHVPHFFEEYLLFTLPYENATQHYRKKRSRMCSRPSLLPPPSPHILQVFEISHLSIVEHILLHRRCGAILPKYNEKALERFSTDAADTENDPSKESIFDEKVEELETSLDLPLQLVYMKQLALLREKALQRYKTLAKGSETSDYQVRTQWFQVSVCEVWSEPLCRGANPSWHNVRPSAGNKEDDLREYRCWLSRPLETCTRGNVRTAFRCYCSEPYHLTMKYGHECIYPPRSRSR